MSIIKAVVARELSESVPDYELAANSVLYLTYTAVKADDYFTTGQVTEGTYLSTDDDGGWASGLPDKLPGVYSIGKWTITFNAYETAEISNPYYEGTSSSFTFSSGSVNTVDVNVQLAQAEEDGEMYLHDITLTEEITGDYVLCYSVDGEELVEDSGKAILTEEGITIDGLPGYYSLYVCLKGTDGVTYAEAGMSGILVKGGLTTEVKGELDEITAEAGIGDVNVSYSSATVSSEAGLTAALSDSGISTVSLADDVTLSEAVTISDSKTLNLNGQTLATDSTWARLVSVTVDGTVTITGEGTIENGAGSDITINGGTFSSSYSSDGSSITNYNVCVDGGSLTITGGEFSIDNGDSSSTSSFCVYADASGSTPSSVSITGGTYTTTGDSYAAIKLSGCVGTDTESDDNPVKISGVTINTATGTGIEFEATDGVVEDCVINVTGKNSYYSAAIAVCFGSDVTINSGVYTAPYAVCIWSSGGTATVNGGTFTGTTYVLYAEFEDTTYGSYFDGAYITTYGGTFCGASYTRDNTNAVISFYGGTFDSDPADYLGDGYSYPPSTEDSVIWYTVTGS